MQKEWDEAAIASNKLHDILPKLSGKLLSYCKTGKEDTVIYALLVGHFYLTHSFILKNRRAPVCVACNTTITIKHSLLECADLVEVRKKCFEERSLYAMSQNVNPAGTLGFFIKIIIFYSV